MSSRRWIILLFCLIVPLFVLPYSAATGGLRVNEATTRILLREGLVQLAVENSSGGDVAAHVRLELLDPANSVLAVVERDVTIQPGASNVVVPLSIPEREPNASMSGQEALWYRLRCLVLPTSSDNRTINSVESIIALSEITPDIFELQVAAPQRAREGALCRLHVRATHPISSRPVKNVSVAAEIDFDEDERKAVLVKATGMTDPEGYATLNFNLPRDIKDENVNIKVVGSLGNLVQEASSEIELDHSARILLNTDKPLYQPGQVMHVRALIFDTSRHAMPEADATLKITDEKGETVFRTALKTSRFGVASADWTIPAGARLGDYAVWIEMNEGEYDNSARAAVKISRYDLPNFAVIVHPDREYYLPGQAAEVEVRADYLFGEAVKRGHVRVVRERERRWSYAEQKWETEEGTEIQGDLNEEGRFIAHIDLEEEQQGFTASGDQRFRDLTYAAYLTDPTTNRTEQRRFDLRLTKDAIHIYVTEANYSQAEGLPLEFYLSTYYADGTPASCEVAISEYIPASSTPTTTTRSSHHSETKRVARVSERLLEKVRTNRFGVARVKGPVIARGEGSNDRTQTLTLAARDRKGKTGRHDEDFSISRETAIRVETNQTLYRAGEPLKARITSNRPDLAVILDVARDLQVIHSEVVRLSNGEADVTLPYSPEFKDRLTIAASAEKASRQNYYQNYVTGRRTVLYPRDRELKLDVQLAQDTYRPGDEASADVTVLTPDGRPIESALGVVVLDKAVEERARTNQEFGAYGFYNNFQGFMYGYDNLSGITHRELERIDFHHGVPEGVELAAEVLLQNAPHSYELNVSNRANIANKSEVFSQLTSTQLLPVNNALNTYYLKTTEYPVDASSLRRVLSASGINFDAVRDPWGVPYRPAFSIDKAWDVIEMISAGPDKRFDTADDFSASRMTWPYFLKVKNKINHVIAEYYTSTGGFIRDAATLKNELRREGLDFDRLRDRWGRPYAISFGITSAFFTIDIRSGGPNRRFDGVNRYASDDFSIWTMWSSYFAEPTARIDAALAAYARAKSRFPLKEAELRDALRGSGVELESLRDQWGHRYYVDYRTEVRPVSSTAASSEAQASGQSGTSKVTPNTQQVSGLRLFSAGPDGRVGTYDDFTVATFLSTNYELGRRTHKQRFAPAADSHPGPTGSISGNALDPNGAAIAGAKLTITDSNGLAREVMTNDEGFFEMKNLEPGLYTMRVEQTGFKIAIVQNVEVIAGKTNLITATLEVGTITEVVTVTDVAQVDQSSTAVSMNLNDQFYYNIPVQRSVSSLFYLAPGATAGLGGGRDNPSITGGSAFDNLYLADGVSMKKGAISTPRLREYFPETLVWQPTLETDVEGHARLNFKLADNITTWKMSVIGSTVDGEIGMAETEFRAFQPFFVEHDPPRILTAGDEIELPVVVRNYMDKPQAVELEIKPESWFTLLGPPQKHTEVAARDSARETFRFRAIAMVDDGKQRINASATEANDAIEKPVSVHPDGREIALTDSRILDDQVTLEASIPESAIVDATRAEVKIYPNLMAHVVESIEGILQRPYGCGEQTISSTYPSVLVLQAYKRTGGTPPPKAKRYTQEGYERLLNYRTESGGFSYWGGKSEADLALTAYALRFLNDARGFIAVDEEVIEQARAWLVKQQSADGGWNGEGTHGIAGGGGAASLTSFIARVLAMAEDGGTSANTNAQSKPSAASDPLARAFNYLSHLVDNSNDPYLISSYTLAALHTGRKAEAGRALVKLRALAKSEGAMNYWNTETSTPFYGWGLTGQIETTALVVQALARSRELERPEAKRADLDHARLDATNDERLISRGLIYLLRNKDRYGVWLSTQATINVLDTFIATTRTGVERSAGTKVEIMVNGRPAETVLMPQGDLFDNPLSVDISRFISSGSNRVEIRRPNGSPQATAQLVSTYWIPWSTPVAASDPSLGHAPSNALRLTVAFDKTEAKAGDEVTCSVNAARVGAYGYGMLLAEIGLPPGADVDRASLEKAMQAVGWSLYRYDILPDRLVVYLWPQTGGVHFEFKFRPRYGLAAQTAPSVLYDYYNPDARTTVAPTKFTVH